MISRCTLLCYLYWLLLIFACVSPQCTVSQLLSAIEHVLCLLWQGASYPLQVIASSQPSAYHSVAVGSGLGSHYNPGLSFMPLPANATQAVAYVLAGVNYSVTVTGYDNWNNRQQVSKPGFVLNQGDLIQDPALIAYLCCLA